MHEHRGDQIDWMAGSVWIKKLPRYSEIHWKRPRKWLRNTALILLREEKRSPTERPTNLITEAGDLVKEMNFTIEVHQRPRRWLENTQKMIKKDPEANFKSPRS